MRHYYVRKIVKTFSLDYPIHIDTICIELSILYFKGLPLKISIKWCISVSEDSFFIFVYIFANSADPDEVPPYEAFHLGLYCLPIYPKYVPVYNGVPVNQYLFASIQNKKN